MDTIIESQKIARRRRPYSPISGQTGSKKGGLGHASGKASSGKPGPGGSRGPAPLWFENPELARRAAQEAAPLAYGQRPARRSKASAGKGGFGRALKDAAHSGMGRLAGLARAALAGIPRLSARKRPAEVAAGGMDGATRLLEATPPVAAPPAKAALRPSSRAELRLRRALLGLGLAFLVLVIVFAVLSVVKPRFPLPEGGLLPSLSAPTAQAGEVAGAASSMGMADGASTALSADEALLLEYISPEFAAPADAVDIANLPLPRAVEISSYTVRKGDSISSISRQFGRSPDSILSMNGIKNAKSLKIGTELKIPSMDGLLHVVAKGESLGSIAKRYKVELTLLADANDLGSTTLKVGQSLFIPGAKLGAEELRRIYGTAFAWPVRGPISSWFGIRADPFTGVRRFHAGIDIVVNLGTPVKAAADGRVADLGYNASYGNYIILSHPDGSQTLYGHLSAFSVTRGQSVTLGKVIGKSGNSGYSTGPHLHFGLYRNGVAVNPLKSLK